MFGKHKFVLAALAALAFLAVPFSSAKAGVGISIGIGAPCHHHHYVRPCYRPAVVVAAPPCVVARPVVAVEPATVYYAAPPVYVRPACSARVVFPIR